MNNLVKRLAIQMKRACMAHTCDIEPPPSPMSIRLIEGLQYCKRGSRKLSARPKTSDERNKNRFLGKTCHNSIYRLSTYRLANNPFCCRWPCECYSTVIPFWTAAKSLHIQCQDPSVMIVSKWIIEQYGYVKTMSWSRVNKQAINSKMNVFKTVITAWQQKTYQ